MTEAGKSGAMAASLFFSYNGVKMLCLNECKNVDAASIPGKAA